jgi:hypothetical protein
VGVGHVRQGESTDTGISVSNGDGLQVSSFLRGIVEVCRQVRPEPGPRVCDASTSFTMPGSDLRSGRGSNHVQRRPSQTRLADLDRTRIGVLTTPKSSTGLPPTPPTPNRHRHKTRSRRSPGIRTPGSPTPSTPSDNMLPSDSANALMVTTWSSDIPSDSPTSPGPPEFPLRRMGASPRDCYSHAFGFQGGFKSW